MVKLFPHGAIEIKDPSKDHTFKVNEHGLKSFLEMPSEVDTKCLLLREPSYLK